MALDELAVVPITCLSDKPASARVLLVGEALMVLDRAKGELFGVERAPQTELVSRD